MRHLLPTGESKQIGRGGKSVFFFFSRKAAKSHCIVLLAQFCLGFSFLFVPFWIPEMCRKAAAFDDFITTEL